MTRKNSGHAVPHQEIFDTVYRLWGHPRTRRQDIIAFQTRKLRVLIDHAYQTVPYYRRLFHRYGLRPGDIRKVDDLALLPITSSKHFRVQPLKELLAAGVNADQLVVHHTSGSSGRPFAIRRAFLEEHLLGFFRIRAMRQLGLRVFDRIANIAVTEGLRGRPTLRTKVPGQLRQALGIYRKYSVNCMQPAERIVQALVDLRPDVIAGYPVVLSHIAPVFDDVANSADFPRLLFTGGESLTPYRRRTICRAFGTRVFDFYGANECNLAAWECPQTGHYHVCDDNVVMEIIRNGRSVKEGESGEAVITCLHSYAMPFIRYSLGDIVGKGA